MMQQKRGLSLLAGALGDRFLRTALFETPSLNWLPRPMPSQQFHVQTQSWDLGLGFGFLLGQ